MIIMARRQGHATVRGHLVEIVQHALTAQGCDTGSTDGALGSQSEAALRLWQRSHGRPVTGTVSEAEWEMLTGLPTPSARDLCMQASAAIGGHGFTRASGNFDGSGIAWGYCGFALTGTLPRLLAAIDGHASAGSRARSIFGESRWDALLRAARGTIEERRAFGDAVSLGTTRRHLRPDWDTAFDRLGRLPAVQRLQLEAATPAWRQTVVAAACLGATDLAGLGLLYDACLRHGAIPEAWRCPPYAIGDRDRRRAWADALVEAVGPHLRDRERARAMLFADGSGTLGGVRFDLDHWGFAMALPAGGDLASAPLSVRPDGPAPRPPVAWPRCAPLSEGHRGEEVCELQRMLNAAGAGLPVDGHLGRATALALSVFQARHGLPRSGTATPRTLAELQVAASAFA